MPHAPFLMSLTGPGSSVRVRQAAFMAMMAVRCEPWVGHGEDPEPDPRKAAVLSAVGVAELR
jgi:putative component of membrane protein insertase Oxa1/YidC/SpoIIIJ protein YidD